MCRPDGEYGKIRRMKSGRRPRCGNFVALAAAEPAPIL
jgi:hypothetical protein